MSGPVDPSVSPVPVDDRLTVMRQLADEATVGPWEASLRDDGRFYGQPATFDVVSTADCRIEPVVTGGCVEDGGPDLGAAELPDAQFIAAAREAVPWLLDEIERLRNSLQACRDTGEWVMHEHVDLAEECDALDGHQCEVCELATELAEARAELTFADGEIELLRRQSHVPQIVERSDGAWGVICAGCSSAQSDYVHECQEGFALPTGPLPSWREVERLRSDLEETKFWHDSLKTIGCQTDALGDALDEIERMRRELAAQRSARRRRPGRGSRSARADVVRGYAVASGTRPRPSCRQALAEEVQPRRSRVVRGRAAEDGGPGFCRSEIATLRKAVEDVLVELDGAVEEISGRPFVASYVRDTTAVIAESIRAALAAVPGSRGLACCGHERERHGPEAGGCIECRCTRVPGSPETQTEDEPCGCHRDGAVGIGHRVPTAGPETEEDGPDEVIVFAHGVESLADYEPDGEEEQR